MDSASCCCLAATTTMTVRLFVRPFVYSGVSVVVGTKTDMSLNNVTTK